MGVHVLDAARAGRLRLLWVFDHDLLDSGWPEAEVEEALGRVEGVIFQGPNANRTSARAHVILPERGLGQARGDVDERGRPRPAVLARGVTRGEARADWEILAAVARALGHEWRPARAEPLFRELAAQVPAFAGLSYKALGDHGAPVADGSGVAR